MPFDSINPTIFNGVGVVGISIFIVIAFIRGWIVSRRQHQDMIDDRNHWRDLAEDSQQRLTKLLVMSELGINAIRSIEKKANAQEGGGG